MSPVAALQEALAALRRGPSPTVLVDGRSGSGKTTFAATLAARGRATLVRLDDVYPGWDGLDAASTATVAGLLAPRAAGVPPAIRRWDWEADRAAGVRRLRPAGPLVVEGCGALSRASRRFVALTIWVELPGPERRVRALARDGAAYAPHWERWSRQERRFIAREDPRSAADLLVDGREFPWRAFSAPAADPHYPRTP